MGEGLPAQSLPLPSALAPLPPVSLDRRVHAGASECHLAFAVTRQQLAKWIKEIPTPTYNLHFYTAQRYFDLLVYYDSRKSQYFSACQGWRNLNELLNQVVNLPITDFSFSFQIYNDEKQTQPKTSFFFPQAF